MFLGLQGSLGVVDVLITKRTVRPALQVARTSGEQLWSLEQAAESDVNF